MDDGGFGKLTHSILSNRCIGESRERAWEGFCVGKAGKPATDLTCTIWRTHTHRPSQGGNEAEQEDTWVFYLIPGYHLDGELVRKVSCCLMGSSIPHQTPINIGVPFRRYENCMLQDA